MFILMLINSVYETAGLYSESMSEAACAILSLFDAEACLLWDFRIMSLLLL